ncbi:S8 family serine peptidase [Candidatus Roizmanbacteria bacterium]|nr:S8 family serine peptidase [Candidatus Roizmanbacteria bacterium]
MRIKTQLIAALFFVSAALLISSHRTQAVSFPTSSSPEARTQFLTRKIIIKLKSGYRMQEKSPQEKNIEIFSEQRQEDKDVASLKTKLSKIGVSEIKRSIPHAKKPSDLRSLSTEKQIAPDLTQLYTITLDPKSSVIDLPRETTASPEDNPELFAKYQILLRMVQTEPLVETAQLNYVYKISELQDSTPTSQPCPTGNITPTLTPSLTTTPYPAASPSATPIPINGDSPSTPTPTISPCASPTPSVSPTPLPYPNDPYFWSSNSWGQGYDDQWDMKKIQADRVWNLGVGSSMPFTTVAVIDTGVDYNHEDLRDVMWTDENGKHGYDFVNNDDDPMDDHYHGTHVAGTIGASVHNAHGIAGVSDRVRIMAIKGLNRYGIGFDDRLAESIIWATNHGAKVINMSWGARQSDSPILRQALDYAQSQGVVSVAAAGNSFDDVIYYTPASFPNVIAVAASSPNDTRVPFSNWGLKIDVSAPGGGSQEECNAGLCENILSTESSSSAIPLSHKVATNGAGYARLMGTSMAAPHVAGAAALVLSHNSNLSSTQVRNVLANAADDVDIEGKDTESGYGRLNVYRAVTEMQRETPTNPQLDVIMHAKGRIIRQSFTIQGSVHYPQSQGNLSVSFATSARGPWRTEGISLTNNGQGEIENGILATWNTNGIADGTYYLKIAANSDKKTTFIATVLVSNYVPNGWPVNVFKQGLGIGPMVTGDIDGDRRDDVLIRLGSELTVLDEDGRAKQTNPLPVADYHAFTYSNPAIGNVSLQNPGNEIVIASQGSLRADPTILQEGLYVLDKNLNAVNGWPKNTVDNYRIRPWIYSPVLADLDGNETKEIIYVSYNDGQSDLLTVFRGDGSVMPGFPIRLPGFATGSPLVVRMNSSYRIIVPSYSSGAGRMLSYDTNGRLTAIGNELPKIPTDAFLADVTNDNAPEIIWKWVYYPDANTDTNKIYLYATSASGTLLTNWPKVVDTGISFQGDCSQGLCLVNSDYILNRVLPFDVNLDGKPDIVVFGLYTNIEVPFDYSHDRPVTFALINNAIVQFTSPSGARAPLWYSHPSIIDTNGDGRQEIVYVAYDTHRGGNYYLSSLQLNTNVSSEVILNRQSNQECEYGDFAGSLLAPTLASLDYSRNGSILFPVCGKLTEHEQRLDIIPIRMTGNPSLHAWPQYLHDSAHSNQYALVPENYPRITDTFNKSNNTASLGTTQTGQPWIVTKGRFGISNNQAYVSTRCPAPGYSVVDSGDNNGLLEVTLAANYQDARIPFRYIDENNYYWVERRGRDYMFARRYQGRQSGMGIRVTPANGDVVKIEFRGTSIKVYINESLKLTRTENLFPTATKHGIGVWCDTRNRFDNFSIYP